MAEPKIPTPVAHAIAHANAGDTDGFLACFAPNGSVDDWGRVFTGHAAIRDWSDQEFIGVHVSLDVRDHTVSGDTTVVTAEVGGDGFDGPSHFTFVVSEGLIDSMRITE